MTTYLESPNMIKLIAVVLAATFSPITFAQSPAKAAPKVDEHGHKHGDHKHDEKKEKAAKNSEKKNGKK